MADYADKSADTADTFLRASLTWRREEVDAPGGKCLNCEAEIDLLQRWCDNDCRDDWQKRAQHHEPTPEDKRKTMVPFFGETPDDKAGLAEDIVPTEEEADPVQEFSDSRKIHGSPDAE